MTDSRLPLSILTLCMSLSLSAMDYNEIPLTPIYQTQKETTKTNMSLDTLVNSINTAINKKHGTNNVITNIFAPLYLSEEKMLDIINTIDNHATKTPLNHEILNALYKKNDLFKKAINYFSDIALNSLKNVTCSTLSLIEQSHLPQSNIQFNQFSLPMKSAIINEAKYKIEHSYDIKLAGHTDTVLCFDISPTAHLAATASDDHTTRIWDLKTGILDRILQHTDGHIVSFNPSGSRLATVQHQSNNKSIINEWNPRSGKFYWSIQAENNVSDVEYVQNTSNKILSVITIKSMYEQTQRWLLVNKKTPELLGTIDLEYTCYRNKHSANSKCCGDYFAQHPKQQLTDRSSTLYVTKNNCRSLYLCEQAIKNTNSSNLFQLVEQSISYNTLTEYEKNMVQTQIKEKTAALLLMKKKEKEINKYLDTLGLN